MISDPLVKSCARLLAQVLEFKVPTDALLSKFFRGERKLSALERNTIAETIYIFLRNYNKITAIISISEIYTLIVYIWLNYLHLSATELSKLKIVNVDAISKLPQVNRELIELPTWIIKLLNAHHDMPEIIKLAAALEKPAPLTLRVNILKMSVNEVLKAFAKANIIAKPTRYSPYGITLANKLDLIKNPLFLNGVIEVQDEASQLAGMLLAPKRNDMVVDFCAGSGGKTLLFGMLMRNHGRIYALDINERRLGNLSLRLKRSGLSNIYPLVIDHETANRLKRLYGKIDRVFVDAPCLGLGTLRRNPDLKFRYNEESLKQINQEQLSILTAASKLLKPGGRLVYATCSILYEENQTIINQFLASDDNFSLVDIASSSELNLPSPNPLADLFVGHYLILNPALHATDGFFAAVIQKNLK